MGSPLDKAAQTELQNDRRFEFDAPRWQDFTRPKFQQYKQQLERAFAESNCEYRDIQGTLPLE
jgi:hypothetical protein